MAILLSLLALGLLALIVYLLHSYQQQQKIDSVDRTVPLPPLQGDISLVGNRSSIDTRDLPAATPATSDMAATEESTLRPSEPAEPMAATIDWLAKSRALKEQNNFDQALEVTRSAYPQIGAFRQACVILRAQLREQHKQGHEQEETLRALYHTCALAAFFHARDNEIPPLSLSAQRRLNDRSWLQLPMPYDQLGTLHLDLLTTTDLKMLTATWGKPLRHQRARQYHAHAWNALQESL